MLHSQICALELYSVILLTELRDVVIRQWVVVVAGELCVVPSR